MGTKKKTTPATKRRRSRSGVAGGAADRGRWSSKRKAEVVVRILKGEALDALSRELKVSTSRLSEWRDEFMASGQAGLMSREPDHRDEQIKELHAKIGEQTMEIELLNEKVDSLEDGLRPPSRRPR